ncbi:MAG: hypothetical protein LBS77_01445 [Desulfovibrio sp.]|nr:hypothetical protein [Desulfovibrio sp.]
MLKIWRMYLKDTVSMSIGTEFHGCATTIIGEEIDRIKEAASLLSSGKSTSAQQLSASA